MKLTKVGAGAAIVALDRELSDSSEKELLILLDSASRDHVRNILLDFNQVDMMNNTGINVLIKLHTYTKKSRQRLLAIGVNKRYVEIFNMTGLDKIYQVYASLAEVLRAVGPAGPDLKSMLERPDEPRVCAGPQFACWAPSVQKIAVPTMPPEAVNLNVHGRRTQGPVQGFGQLWEKIYTVDLSDTNMSPEQIIGVLKEHFAEFQPLHNRFYVPATGINPGDVIIINALTPGGLVATGVLVLYSGQRTFTFITPQGHPEAGWVTFRSFIEDGRTIMQIQGLARASDPLYEIAFRLAGSDLQEQIWTYLLQSLAKYTGGGSPVRVSRQCLDGSLQWQNFVNVFWNAQIPSMIYGISHSSKKK
jgi:anti-anti-sigma factor